jgi:polyphosphate kinase 2
MTKNEYEEALYRLHVELVKLQRHVIDAGGRVLVVLEGRDAAGKDGAIKTITRHMSPRETRVFAPAKPSDRERGSWYFQRFVPHLPAAGEIVIFNRSWYNRAGVERVMGFCTPEEVEGFLDQAPVFDRLLVEAGIHLIKVYLDVSRAEQERRLAERVTDPLKQWKLSPIDQRACELWGDYTVARDEMLARTHVRHAPWVLVRADRKKRARLELMRHLLASVAYPGREEGLLTIDRRILFPFGARAQKRLSR